MARLRIMLIADGAGWWSARSFKVIFTGGPNLVGVFPTTGFLTMMITGWGVWGGQIRTVRGFLEANWDCLATKMVMIMMMMVAI